MMKKIVLLSLFVLTGCFQEDCDDDLWTVPITNNPYIVPTHGNGLPGMSGDAGSPR